MWKLSTALGGVCAMAMAVSAQAQLVDDLGAESVRDRPRPEYDPRGILLGRFVARPDFRFGVRYDDNIFARQEETQEDLIVNARASGVVGSDFRRHEVAVFYDANYDYFTDVEDESNLDARLGVRGRLDFLRDSAVTTEVSYARQNEARVAADTVLFVGDLRDILIGEFGAGSDEVDEFDSLVANGVFTDEPVVFEVFSAGLGVRHRFDQLRLVGNTRVDRVVYEDGDSAVLGDTQQFVSDALVDAGEDPLLRLENKGVVDQSFRDRTEVRGSLRGEYQFTPGAFALAEVVVKDTDFTFDFESVEREDGTQDPVRRDRSSTGYEVLLGAGFDLTRLLRGEIGGRFVTESFDNEVFEDADGFGLSADLTWLISTITNLTFEANTEVRPTSLEDASSILATSAGLTLDHEFDRNIIFYGELNYFLEDFQELDREDERFEYGVGLLYLLDNRYSVEMNVARSEQESTGFAGRDFDVNRVSAALQVRF